MSAAGRRVAVVPCSGIGKSLGTVSREAAYELCDVLRPDATQLVALSKLVLGDAEARERVRANAAVTIDGCKQMCAAKLVKHSGGNLIREVAVFEVFRNHKDLKPEGIAELNPEGKRLARVLAKEIAELLDEIRLDEGGQHA
ncbi:MAG: putative zinc-binding protein [Acidobacteriia bacterium]|nr:putative zinc-binding protein [Terriglobia bacterium]